MSELVLVALSTAFVSFFATLRYVAYLCFAWHVSRRHGVKGLREIPPFTGSALPPRPTRRRPRPDDTPPRHPEVHG